MDPITMILAFAMKNPQVATSTFNNYNTPGQVNAAMLESSAADFAMQALNCYHKSARFRGVDILGAPWKEQSKYGADGSVVMRINFSGVSRTPYQMVVAAMAKDRSYRAFVINENSLIRYNKRCSLEYWTAAESQ
jgi:hypothetical protein